MSKYEPLWNYVKNNGISKGMITFSEINEILGFEIDHSFLNYKKELFDYGYEIVKISIQDKLVYYQVLLK